MNNEKSLALDARTRVRVDAVHGDEIETHREDIFFAAIQTTRMPMLVTDPTQPDNPIVFVNRAFVSMTGYPVESLLGRNCRFLQGPETDRQTIAEIRSAIDERRECNVEILNYRADGSSFWNALFISPVLDKSGAVVYFFASQLDVSRRRDAEEALAHSQKMEALGQLTGGIAHDFNNLLHVMSGHVELLRRHADRPDGAARTTRGVEMIARAVDKAASLTQQLLAFSRKQSLRGRVVNLNTLARGMEELSHRTLGAHVTVRYELAPDLPNCEIDPTQFETSVLNLLVNARDAMADGGEIRIRTEKVDIGPDDPLAYRGLEAGRYAALSVSDDGTGIPAELVDRVMDPFFTTKDEGRGTGLGLSMVYGYTKQSRGTTTIDSEVGVGTTVRMYFPASTAVVHATAAAPAAEANRGGTERILVVDDRPEVGELVSQMLDELGYRVEFVDGGRAALSLLGERDPSSRPDLVFSDVVMPGGMNGYALAREIGAAFPDVKVLLTTGFDRDFAPTDDRRGGHYDVIRKPYRMTDLAKRVRAVLDGPTASGGATDRPSFA